MKNRNVVFRVTIDFFEQLTAKAGMIPLSRIIRRLLEKWLAGEINLD